MSQLPLTVQATLTGGVTGLTCIFGQVSLFRFIQPPQPGSVIGQVTPLLGSPIPLVQTQPTPLGGIPLSSVDGQFATLCGVFVRAGGQTALDVRVVNPGAPSPTGTPTQPVDLRLLLLLLLLGGGGQFGQFGQLGQFGQFGKGVSQGLAQIGLGAGTGVNVQALASLLGQATVQRQF